MNPTLRGPMLPTRLSLRTANLGKLIIPLLLGGVYILWLYDRSHRAVYTPTDTQWAELVGAEKPYKHFQQLSSTEQDAGSFDEGLSLEAAQQRSDYSRKVSALGDTVGRHVEWPAATTAQAAGEVAAAHPMTSVQASGQSSSGQEEVDRREVAGTAVDEEEAAAPSAGAVLDSADTRPAATEKEIARRMAAVKEAMQHSWKGYADYAWGDDELQPVSKSGANGLCDTGASILDALDTLWLMDMKAEFAQGRDWVADNLRLNMSCRASLFEIVIRDVGGLLAAHDLSGDALFLTKAEDFAGRMMTAFETPTGIPLGVVDLAANATWGANWAKGGGSAVLSELGSIQVEFVHLSQLSGDAKYGAAAERVIQFLHDHFDQGLLPTYIDFSTGDATEESYTVGAMGDSYYEYLLKVWILTGKSRPMYRDMWVRAMDEMAEKLVRTSSDGLTFVGDIKGNFFQSRMEHLSCFVAGNLALGVQAGAVEGDRADAYLALARNLTRTCFQMYQHMPSGLSPEFVYFNPGGMTKGVAYNILRPEAVESMLMLWRVTGDPVFREYGWDVFQAFQQYSRVSTGGYSGVLDVGMVPPIHDDKQQTFWLAETLKYLYLLFSPASAMPLDQWVFNTEAHPLRIPALAAAGGGGAPAVSGSIL